jgi:hypothetical protein
MGMSNNTIPSHRIAECKRELRAAENDLENGINDPITQEYGGDAEQCIHDAYSKKCRAIAHRFGLEWDRMSGLCTTKWVWV